MSSGGAVTGSTPGATPSGSATPTLDGEDIASLFRRFGPAYQWYATITVLVGATAMVLSSTIANVAVPEVMGAFGVGQDQAQWLATAFLTAMTASQLLNAWVVKAFGQRLAYQIVITLFLAGTFVCASANSIELLIVGRIMQGLSAGVVQPLSMVTIFQVFPLEKRGLAMGMYGFGITMAPGIGPTLGGFVIDTLSWRWMFLIPVPLCIAALITATLFMPQQRVVDARGRHPLPPFDWFAFGLLCTALFLLMDGAASGRRMGWESDQILFTLGGGAVAALAFVFHQLWFAKAPLLDFALYRNPRFAAALLVTFVFGLGNFASSYIIPVFVQAVQGYTPTRAGMVLLPAGLLLTFLLPITGRIADKMPDHIMTMIGLGCFALGATLMVPSDVNTGFWMFALFTVIGRVGLAFIMPSLSGSALKALPPEQLNRGSGNINFIRQLGGAVGTNMIVVWLELRTQFHADNLTATQTWGNQTTRRLLDMLEIDFAKMGLPHWDQKAMALDQLGKMVQAQASTLGFQDAFLLLAAVFVLALFPAWMLGQAGKRAAAGKVATTR